MLETQIHHCLRNIICAVVESKWVEGVPALFFGGASQYFRIQKVRIADQLSASLYVKASVTQGSVLSVTLFLVFIEDLLILLFNGKSSAFADHIAYFYSGKFSPGIWVDISEDLELLRYW